MSFIDDPTLPFPKFELNPFAGDPAKNIAATDWNTICQSLLDLRTAVSAASKNLLVIKRADSNGVGAGTNSTGNGSEEDAGLLVPNPNVVYMEMYATAFAEPVTPVNMNIGPLRAKNSASNTSPACGLEIALGRELNAMLNGVNSTPDAAHKLWIEGFEISSTKLSDWMSGSTSGNASPLLGGSNLSGDSDAKSQAAMSISGRTPLAEIIQLGTNDSSTSTDAAALLTNFPAYISHRRSILGSQTIFIVILMQSTLPEPFIVTARANEITALTGLPGVIMVSAEGLPTIVDQIHFIRSSEETLGERCAFAIARAAGIVERAVTVPTVVGVGRAAWNGTTSGLSGITGTGATTLIPRPWQGSAARDLILLPSYAGFTASPASIPTPSGWTSVDQGASAAGGITSQFALFDKALAQAELDGNGGFPLAPTVAPAGSPPEFAARPFTVRGGAIDGSVTRFSAGALGTSVTAGGVTTSAPNGTILVVILSTQALTQVTTVTNSNVTNLVKVSESSYDSAGGFKISFAVWQCTLPAAGASGNFAVAATQSTNLCGWVVALKAA